MTNRILFNKAEPMGDYLLVPFTCSDIGTMHLHLPSYDRTDAENDMAKAIGARIAMALIRAGYEMVNLSFNSMKVKVKPIPPVKY